MVEYEKRPMIAEEDKYTFRQSTQISGQCGLIGHLRGDMGSSGNEFHTTWWAYRQDMRTDEFAHTLDDVINSLREQGDILENRAALSRYAYETPQSKMNTDRNFYGVRVDTEKYAFLLRLCPDKGDYNLYCYCYRRDWLDDHIRRAAKGIRFVDTHYKEKFRIQDGDKIRITYRDGESVDRECRYIDDYHAEIGDNIFHICEFAERMETSAAKAIPLRSSLPEAAYVFVPSANEIGIVKKGESGYYKTGISFDSPEEGKALVEQYNAKHGVSKAQAVAMSAGSMFGWETPAADPANYDAGGAPVKAKHRDRGDAR